MKAPATFFVPGEPLASKSPKKGDKLTLEVVFVDPENGDLEVKVAENEMTEEEKLRPMLAEAFEEEGPESYG